MLTSHFRASHLHATNHLFFLKLCRLSRSENILKNTTCTILDFCCFYICQKQWLRAWVLGGKNTWKKLTIPKKTNLRKIPKSGANRKSKAKLYFCVLCLSNAVQNKNIAERSLVSSAAVFFGMSHNALGGALHDIPKNGCLRRLNAHLRSLFSFLGYGVGMMIPEEGILPDDPQMLSEQLKKVCRVFSASSSSSYWVSSNSIVQNGTAMLENEWQDVQQWKLCFPLVCWDMHQEGWLLRRAHTTKTFARVLK